MWNSDRLYFFYTGKYKSMPDRVIDVMGEMTQGVRTAAYGVYVMMGIAAFPVVLMVHNVRQMVVGDESEEEVSA